LARWISNNPETNDCEQFQLVYTCHGLSSYKESNEKQLNKELRRNQYESDSDEEDNLAMED
jgi:hypothetical protein